MIRNDYIFESIMAGVNEEMELDKEKAWEFLMIVSEFARGANEDVKEEILNICEKKFENLKKIAEAGISDEC